MNEPKILGLSLSGGGYRAAAFHLGTLRKLNTLGILDKVEVISTISGGSIAGAFYTIHQKNFQQFDTSLKACLQKSVIKKILLSRYMLFTYVAILGLPTLSTYLAARNHSIFSLFPWFCGALSLFVLILILIVFQFKLLPFSGLKQKAYDKIFFKNAKLADLQKKPLLAINSTNLETGTLWTYSQEKVSDSSYEYYKNSDGVTTPILFNGGKIPVSMAVASSTNVPFVFNPVRIGKAYFVDKTQYAIVTPQLIDGGVYDNQGIHKLSQEGSSYRCKNVIASDGSQPFAKKFIGNNSLAVMYRANDIMMRKIKNMQFIRDVYGKSLDEIAYYSLDWYYSNCISSFVDLLIQGKLSERLVMAHGLIRPVTTAKTELKVQRDKLIAALETKIGYQDIVKQCLTNEQINAIAKIGTGLSALSEKQIESLAQHAATLTEIQLKLYCPTLMKTANAI